MASLKNTTVSGTDAITLPIGTTAQRPASPVVGMMRYNTSQTMLETYNGTSWAYSPPIITNGLALYLDAAEPASYSGTGSTWTDLSGNGNNCTLTNSPTYSSSNGGYLTFNGTNQYGTITNVSSLNFATAQTLIMAMRPKSTVSRQNPWNQAYAGYGTWTYEPAQIINNYFGNGGADNTPYVGYSSQSVPVNTWSIASTSRSTTTHNWYVNGVLGATNVNPYGTLTTTSANITIAAGYASYFNADIAVILAYTRALSGPEIQQNFNALRRRFSI